MQGSYRYTRSSMDGLKRTLYMADSMTCPTDYWHLRAENWMNELRVMKQEVKVYHLNEYFSESYFETKKLVYVKG